MVPGDQLLARGTLEAQPAPGNRAVRVAFNLNDPLVFDVDVLGAADGAIRAYGMRHAVGGRCARHQSCGPI